MTGCYLYIGAVLPSLSETFVYNELFALRGEKKHILGASVYPATLTLNGPLLMNLAKEVIPVYGLGPLNLLFDAAIEIIRHPRQSSGTLKLILHDVLFSMDITFARRFKVLWQFLAGIALANRVKKYGITHIHAHMAHVPTTIAMYAAKQLGISFSFTGHANDLFVQRTLLPEKLKRAKFVACISYWHREFYKGIVNLPDDRFPIVRCGVTIPEIQHSLSSSNHNCSILAVGRLVPKKGYDVLLQAIANLAEEGLQVTCRIIGDGPQRKELEALSTSLKIMDRVYFLGARRHEDTRSMLLQADLFVLPCKVDSGGDRDGIPVALMEAMAARVCSISGDLPTIRELIKNEETGLLVPPGDSFALTEAIKRVLTDRNLRNRLAQNGRDWVKTEFSQEVNIKRIMKAFGIVEDSLNQQNSYRS